MDSESRPPGGTLEGWKEISSYLGKSVRAAQRWERDMGLPVHRLKTPASQIVFARMDEIDSWRASNELAPRDATVRNPEPNAWGRNRKKIAWTAAPLAVAAVAVTLVMTGRPKAPPAVDFRFTGNTLEALDAEARVRWRHQFASDERPIQPEEPRPQVSAITRVDLDRDGLAEVVAAISVSDERTIRNDRLYAFAADGRILWRYEPQLSLSFQSGTYTRSFHFTALLASQSRAAGRLWVAVTHTPWWQSAVLELDASGRQTTRFVHAGVIYSLLEWQRPEGLRLIAAGINNEYAAGSLAVLDPAVAARSPQTEGSPYECVDCPADTPLRYLLLPPTDVTKASDLPYNRVSRMLLRDSDGLLVGTIESGNSREGMRYKIGRGLRVTKATPDDGFWVAHRRLEAAGKLTHPAARCPERNGRDVRVWTRESGWQPIEMRTAASALPGAR